MIGTVFDAPVVVKGYTWLPWTQLLAWPVMAWFARKRKPERTWPAALRVGALTMPVVLGSEWGHNLAHAAAARRVGKPVDAIRILSGMPLLVYHDVNAQDVTPRQHVCRALGGPIFNLLLLPLLWLIKRKVNRNSTAYEVAGTALAANLLLPAIGLLPIPFLDGGPILKWSLVSRGQTLPQADQAVRKVNILLGLALSLVSALAYKRSKRLAGGFLSSLAGWAFIFGFGWMKEQAEA